MSAEGITSAKSLGMSAKGTIVDINGAKMGRYGQEGLMLANIAVIEED